MGRRRFDGQAKLDGFRGAHGSAAEAEAASARLVLASAVTRAYFQLDRLHQLRSVAEATLAQREKLQELVRLRQKAGLESKAELQQAAGSIADARKNSDGVKFGIIMDDKFISAEMTWAQIRESSEVAITEWILRYMRDQRREATH